MAAESISVVMITRDRVASTLRSVEKLRALPEAPTVIVVDNGSSDGTAATLRDRRGVQVIELGENLAAAGRNVGVAAATTPYVAFADDDSWWTPGSLARAVELFDAHPRLGLVTGRTLVGPDRIDDPVNAELAASRLGTEPDLPGPSVLGFLACAAIVRRSAYLEVGGFEQRFGVGGEEELFALDLAARGWSLCYVPDLVAEHHPQPSPSRAGRRARQRRNQLWTSLLRRSPATAWHRSLGLVRDARHDPAARQALGETLAAARWLATARRPVPADVEQMARSLERR